MKSLGDYLHHPVFPEGLRSRRIRYVILILRTVLLVALLVLLLFCWLASMTEKLPGATR